MSRSYKNGIKGEKGKKKFHLGRKMKPFALAGGKQDLVLTMYQDISMEDGLNMGHNAQQTKSHRKQLQKERKIEKKVARGRLKQEIKEIINQL